MLSQGLEGLGAPSSPLLLLLLLSLSHVCLCGEFTPWLSFLSAFSTVLSAVLFDLAVLIPVLFSI